MHMLSLILPTFEFIHPFASVAPVLYLLPMCDSLFTVSHQLEYVHDSMVQEPCSRKLALQNFFFHCITKFFGVFHL